MSGLVENHIVGFPTRRLIFSNVPNNGSISHPLYYKADMLMLELDPTRENWSSGFPTRPQGYKSFFMLNSTKTKIYPADKC